VEHLVESRIEDLRLYVTSRPETDIKSILEPLTFLFASIHGKGGQMGDVQDYIRSIVNEDPKNRRWKKEDKQRMIDVLTERADGM